MKQILSALTILLFILLPHYSFAGIVKGTVTDKKAEVLPFATVFVQGTTKGTSANAKGQYILHLEPGSYKIVCQYIGFKQEAYNITITGNETIQHNFSLEDQALQMK